LTTTTFSGALSGNATTATNAGGFTGSLAGDVTGTQGATVLSTTGVSAGTYKSVTVNTEGRVTAGTNPTTLAGYGITNAATSASPTFTGNVTMPETGIWNSSGRVGVGTASPLAPLQVLDVAAVSASGGYYFNSGTSDIYGIPGTSHSVSILAAANIQAAGYFAASDARLKGHIESIQDDLALKFIKESNPVHYTWKTSGEKNYGFIAQDLIKMGLIDVVSMLPASKNEKPLLSETFYRDVYIPEGSKLTVNYNQLIALTTQAIKYIYHECTQLIELVNQHDTDLQDNATRIQILEAENTAIKSKNIRIKGFVCAHDPQAPFCK
jgi:hypothetical protein